jgi:ferric-dicitrate binding protein FerR (iron transport regulator)
MNLTDQEILELNELCGAVADDTFTEAQRTRLSRWLLESEAVREYYVRALAQSASLHSYASEMQSEAPERVVQVDFRHKAIWWASGLAAAAAVIFAVWLPTRSKPTPKPEIAAPGEYVAQLTASKDLAWSDSSGVLRPGDHLRRGQRLELASGHLEITFDSGARIILEGPASLDVNSAWDSTLRKGTLTANVPSQAIGFRVSHASVDVVDLGTEFTMIGDAHGAAEVLVLKGQVEASPRADVDQEAILLSQNEARRFAESGVSDVSDLAKKFALFNQPVPLDRLVPSTHYVHWSFDEPTGEELFADILGVAKADATARLESKDPAALEFARVASPFRKALKFDGQLYARAAFPGISGKSSHTVAFWVRVPENEPLSDAYAMVAWSTSLKKLSARPVHINWNRNPTEGPIGALRTDFGGGHAMGMTSLRDGRWHHVAVVFVPGGDDEQPPQVKQYVDGKLESSTIVPGKTRGPAGPENSSLSDILWLGCRLGPTGPRQDRPGQDRFRGELDELFIADRGLEPNEIVQLMKENQPLSPSALAATP